MPRTARKVEDLAEDGEAMTDALSAVLEVADEQGTVTWGDVSDDLTSGQWGRLIESGLLVDAGGDGFVLDDPEGVREALDEAEPGPSDTDQDTSWSTYDKLAGLGIVALMVGYWQPGIRSTIGETVNLALGPLNAVMPFFLVVMILAILTGLWSTLLMDKLQNKEIMAEFQQKREDLQERRKAAKERGDDEALDRIQEEQMEMMSENMSMFKEQFRPFVWVMLLTIPAFLWMYWIILDQGVVFTEPALVLPMVGELETWTTGVIGPLQAWLLWYFLSSLAFNQILRKALNVQTSPTSG